MKQNTQEFCEPTRICLKFDRCFVTEKQKTPLFQLFKYENKFLFHFTVELNEFPARASHLYNRLQCFCTICYLWCILLKQWDPPRNSLQGRS